MPQFAVYLNKNLRSRSVFPMLVDVQAELLGDLETRGALACDLRRARYSAQGVLRPGGAPSRSTPSGPQLQILRVVGRLG